MRAKNWIMMKRKQRPGNPHHNADIKVNAMATRNTMVVIKRVGSNMDLSWRNGPSKKPVEQRDSMFPKVYNTAKAVREPMNSIMVPKIDMTKPSPKQITKPQSLVDQLNEGRTESLETTPVSAAIPSAILSVQSIYNRLTNVITEQ